jgi:hypothetical protein
LGTLQNQPLASLVRFLRNHHQVKTFVETGTYLGAGTAFGVEVFPEVFSIEVNPEFYAKAKAALEGTHAHLVLGDSRIELPKIVAALTGPAVFWLDGHAGGGHFGASDDCPLIDELTCIAPRRTSISSWWMMRGPSSRRRRRPSIRTSGRTWRRCWTPSVRACPTTAWRSPTR